jgi:hypothetical protein
VPRLRRQRLSAEFVGQVVRTACTMSSMQARVRSPCGRGGTTGGGAGAAFTLINRLMPFLLWRVAPPRSGTEHRFDVLGVVAGDVVALWAGPVVVLGELVVHVLHPRGQVPAGGVQMRMTQDRLHLGEREPLVTR